MYLSSVIIAKFFSFIVFIHYKVFHFVQGNSYNFANYQIFNELYFIELTLIYKKRYFFCCFKYTSYLCGIL